MKLERVVATSEKVAGTRSRKVKIATLADLLADLPTDEIPIAVAYLSGEIPGGAIGIGWRSLADLPGPAGVPMLEIGEVQHVLERIRAAVGPGSRTLRRSEMARLYSRATEREQRFLSALLVGELRQGALEGIMTEAIVQASNLPVSDVRRAIMVSGEPGAVAQAALTQGAEGLARFHLVPLQPLQPMLAQTADDVAAALSRLGTAALEWKLDGARIQAHKSGTEVGVFTRNLANVSSRLPEIVESLRDLEADSFVLDGEAIALMSDGSPYPFQVTMSRFGSQIDVLALRSKTPLSGFFFDCLHINGRDVIDEPGAVRHDVLAGVVPKTMRVPRVVTDDVRVAQDFLNDALGRGHEGIMAKSLTAPYEAGRRGTGWIKVKQAHTLDLVVLAAEWGHGRRQGWLSNLHLGARDEISGGYVMLGKTFKGMTDEVLEWQTKKLLELKVHQEGIVVHVRPELVVEVAFDGLQKSTRYKGGLALRFARIKGYRLDKSPIDGDTIDTVRSIYRGEGRRDPTP